jgi:hypothetical protein
MPLELTDIWDTCMRLALAAVLNVARALKPSGQPERYKSYGPDAYSPEYVQDLLRYALTIDRDEAIAAANLGIERRFQIVSPRAPIAIDAMWFLQAYTLPFKALAALKRNSAGSLLVVEPTRHQLYCRHSLNRFNHFVVVVHVESLLKDVGFDSSRHFREAQAFSLTP